MTIAESLIHYFNQFHELQNGCLHFDFLPEKAAEYAIEINPAENTISTYLGGASIKQIEFVFCSREFYSDEVMQNLANSGFYERLAKWVKTNNKSSILPVLGEGLECEKLTILTPGYLFQNDAQTARYQIQFHLQYFEEA